MANEHIGRKQAIGIGAESSAGTAVAAEAWIPKADGSIAPEFEKAVDDSAYGVIDEVYDSQTVKNTTKIEVSGILRAGWAGYLLLGALGDEVQCDCIEITSPSGGTPAKGDSVYVGSPGSETWEGVIQKIIVIGSTTYYFVSTDSGSLGNGDTITDGTWSGTVASTSYTGVEGHLFKRLNTNAHPTFTIYGSDPVGDERAAYCMVDTLEIEFSVGDFGRFNASFMGKKLESASSQSPSYTADDPFLAKHASVKFASNEAGLNAASASVVQRFKIGINKNLTDVQAFGDEDIDSIHNQQFTISGDLDAIYNATTFRDYVANSTKKACRLQAINDDATALSASGTDDFYPSIYIDMARLSFEEWSRSNDNNGLVNQTMGFSGEFSVDDSMTIEILLINGESGAYEA